MKNQLFNIVISVSLVWLIVIGITTVAFAENPQEFTVNGATFELSANHSNGTVTITDQGSGVITVAATGYFGGGNCDNDKDTVTFTLSNKTVHGDADKTPRQVKFTISVTDDDGTVSGTTSGEQTLKDEAITFTASTGAGSGDTNIITVTITGVNLEDSIVPLATTFKTAVGGTFSVNGTTQTEAQKVYSNAQGTSYTLVASANERYTFYGWQSSAGDFSTASTYTYTPDSDSTVRPVFRKNNGAMYSVTMGGILEYYAFLDEAITAAGSSGTIIVCESGTAYHSDSTQNTFNIPSGVKLLLPYSADNAAAGGNFDENPNMNTTDKYYYNTQSAYVELRLPANTTINCAGQICVDSQIFANTLYSGCPGGPHGRIVLEQGSALNMQSGSTLYAYGYITGVWDSTNKVYTTGTVTAQSGSTVYESFQALGWRGGNLMKKWMNSSSSKSFGFADYALQNIEANYQINNGATSKFVTSLEGSGTNAQVAGTFIANSSGFLQMSSNGSVLRTYDPHNNRINYALSGTMNVGNLNMTLASLGSIDTQKYILGLNHSMDIVVNTDATVTMLYDYKLMPGATVTINSGGKVIVNGDVYIYDTADYVISGQTYAHHQSYKWLKSVPVAYISATGYKSNGFSGSAETATGFGYGISQISSSTPSGKVVVNGTLEVASTGAVYTTSNGGQNANKVITGTGTFINNSTVATGIVTDVLDEAKTIYESAWSQSIEDQNKVVTPAVGLIAGLSTSDSDYKCFEANGAIYHGTESGYWYEYVVEADNTDIITNESVASGSTTIPMTVTASDGTKSTGASTNAVGIVGNGSSITFDSSTNVASTIAAENGTFTFSTNPSCATVTKDTTDEQGTLNTATTPYTLTGVTADTTLSLTVAHADQGDLTCTCGAKLAKLTSLNANADAETELVFSFYVHSSFDETLIPAVVFGTKNSTDFTYTLSNDPESGNKILTVTQPVASGEMTKSVTVSLAAGETAVPICASSDGSCVEAVSSTVAKYAQLVLKSDDSALTTAKDLVDDLLSYGGYAQAYFSDQTGYADIKDLEAAQVYFDGTEVSRPDISAVTADSIEKSCTVEGDSIGISYKSMEGFLGSAIRLNVNFTVPEGFDINNYSSTYKFEVTYKGKKTEVPLMSFTADDGTVKYYVEILNIPAAYLDYEYIITVTDISTGKYFTVTTCVLAYLKNILAVDSGASTELRNLASAMYLYNQAANNFFGV